MSQIVAQTNEIADNTMVALDDQRQQMERIDADVDKVRDSWVLGPGSASVESNAGNTATTWPSALSWLTSARS
jgi:hypothetical protein